MRIVSFTRSVPYRGVPHAGGEYYLHHLEALVAAGHQLVVVAPDDEENREGLSRIALGVVVILVGDEGPRPLYYVDRFNIRFRVAVPPERFVRNVVRDPRVREAVGRADLLEYQWTEFSSIHGRLRRSLRERPAVAVAHDVLAQKFEREAEQAGLDRRARFVARAKSALVLLDETRMLRRMTRVLTFSQKDAARLETMVGKGTVQVVDPPLEPIDDRWPPARDLVRREVLFVAAFYRPENAAGALWFLKEVWPVVRRRLDGVELVLAGVGPSAAMLEAAESDPSIRVTGYVNDLTPYYESAAVAVVPLFAGAGVKFKTITAMLWGIPVVGTRVGTEGIGEPGSRADLFVAETSDPSAFAEAVVTAVERPVAVDDVTRAAYAFAVERYGLARFERRLVEEYAALLG